MSHLASFYRQKAAMYFYMGRLADARLHFEMYQICLK